jgi:transposase
VRDFTKATVKLAKTDAIDARLLAHFAEAVRPSARRLPDATTQALSALVARRRQLVEMLTAEENRRARRLNGLNYNAHLAHPFEWKKGRAFLYKRLKDKIGPRPVLQQQAA